ncbi:hypothetical protein F66182_1509 [Fusarium sp. NRRL 66182]|nr:hypothetical protein F66182_1509 [Fusarium sp. NRRL 66182]
MPHAEAADPAEPKKLILCFDGTGNTFSGSNSDTNVVKILRKLDRNHPSQFHYYQSKIPLLMLIGMHELILQQLVSAPTISMRLDQGFGTTFDAHVIAGYRFLMRYYEPNARIYIFGFSRGAYTAKFLARMVNKVGLLCKGNEEMVPFAYRLYQRYLQGEVRDNEHAQCTSMHGDAEVHVERVAETTRLLGTNPSDVSQQTQEALNEIEAFSQTFCRRETSAGGDEENIKVFFLGIWDCVASVAVLERKARMPVPVTGTAHHVRHAVAVDERRVKFKPALLAQDIRAAVHNKKPAAQEDIREVWFPGNHGDVGGGWPAQPAAQEPGAEELSFWGRIKNAWTTRKANKASDDLAHDRLQMSDIPLEWMVREVKKCGEMDPTLQAKVHWCHSLDPFEASMRADRRREATHGFMHDCLSFGYGTAFFKVAMWKFMGKLPPFTTHHRYLSADIQRSEWLPFITRWELDDRKEASVKLLGWKPVTFTPNRGSYRDIPRGAVIHQSLLDRLRAFPSYAPGNNHGENTPGCFKGRNKAVVYHEERHDNLDEHYRTEIVADAHFKVHSEGKGCVWETDKAHQTYDFNPYFKRGETREILQQG